MRRITGLLVLFSLTILLPLTAGGARTGNRLINDRGQKVYPPFRSLKGAKATFIKLNAKAKAAGFS